MVLQDRFRASQRRAVSVAGIEEQKLRRRIQELAQRHVHWNRRLVYRRLRLEGWNVNHKLVPRRMGRPAAKVERRPGRASFPANRPTPGAAHLGGYALPADARVNVLAKSAMAVGRRLSRRDGQRG